MGIRAWFAGVLVLAAGVVIVLMGLAQPAWACGGFFCQNSPIDQNAERIIFTQNGDGTVSAYIQIQYTGSAPDFSWILPLPQAISLDDIAVPEDGMAAFTELEVATDPVFIPPPLPECAQQFSATLPAMAMAESAAVEVFASGEVGPYWSDVIGSEDPEALITWLRDNEYRVTPEMEPLIEVYVAEGFAFLAMRLLPDSGDQDVEPVKVTYPAERPMIPLRLTAVAANPDMAVMVWFFSDNQAVPVNYAKMEIADEELTFSSFGRTSNYRQLMSARADEYRGQAFVTEYASPTNRLPVTHPLLQQLRSSYPYVTRLNTVISPAEMTVDPVFDYDPQLADVSNIHDLSNMTGLYDCERAEASRSAAPTVSSEQGRNIAGQPDLPDQSASVESGATPADTPALPVAGSGDEAPQRGTLLPSALVALALVILVAVAVALKRRSSA